MSKRFSLNPFGASKRKEEMERVRQENERLQQQIAEAEIQRERTEKEARYRRARQAELESQIAQERLEAERKANIRREQQANVERQLAQEQADRAARERRDRERWEREEREHVAKLAEKQRKRDERIRKLRNVSPESLRTLRELIRARYALDVDIWNLRDVRKPDQHLVIAKMEKADAILHEIYDVVHAWEDTEASWTVKEWAQAMEVKSRLLADGKRWWLVSGAPWDDEADNVVMPRTPSSGLQSMFGKF